MTVSHGSAERCGGIVNDYFVTHFVLSLAVKDVFFENRLIFREYINISRVSCFFDLWCSITMRTHAHTHTNFSYKVACQFSQYSS